MRRKQNNVKKHTKKSIMLNIHQRLRDAIAGMALHDANRRADDLRPGWIQLKCIATNSVADIAMHMKQMVPSSADGEVYATTNGKEQLQIGILVGTTDYIVNVSHNGFAPNIV